MLLGSTLWGAEVRLDDVYVTLLGRIREADTLAASGDEASARRQYAELLKELQAFQQKHGDWYPDVVGYRIRYLESRERELSIRVGEAKTNAIAAVSRTEVDVLRARVLQYEEERAVLQAKLREALAGRPAALDPAELERAEQQIREQRKEIDLLKLQVVRERPGATNAAPERETEALEKLRAELAASRRREAQLVERNGALDKRVKELERQSRSDREDEAPSGKSREAASKPEPASASSEPALSAARATELAAECLDRGDISGAAAVLERVPRGAGTNLSFVAMQARVLIAQGRPEQAVRVLGAAMQNHAATVEIQLQLGRALLAQGSDEAARAVLTKAVAMDPACGGAHLALAAGLARQQPPDLALARWHYGRALQTGARRDPAVERVLGIPSGSTNALPVGSGAVSQSVRGPASTSGR